MASFGKTPDAPAPKPGEREMNMSISCEVCHVRIPKVTFISSMNRIEFVCKNGHAGAINDFGLDLM